MDITIFGYVLIPLLIFLFIVNPKYLIYILIITLTLQVTSLFNIPSLNNYSMQIYRFITLLILIRLIIYLLRNGMCIKFKDKSLKNISISGGLFTLFTIVWSYLAPIIFVNYPVYPPELGIDFSAIYGPSPLHFSIYNIALSAYIFLYIGTLIYILLLPWTKKDLIIIKRVLNICLFIVFITAVSQVFNYLFGTLDITQFLYNITTREFKYSAIGNFLPMPRIQATYKEPSMLAPFLVGFYSYYLYLAFVNIDYINLFLTVLIFFFILLSASTTAYISTLIMTILILLYSNPIRISKFNIYIKKRNMLSLLVITTLFISISILIIFLTIGLDKIINIIDVYLINKSETASFIRRKTADIHALNLFFKTYGCGVGLGSNRPSSLLPYLLSQLGIIGTYLFIVFIIKVSYFCYKTLKDTEYFSFFFLIPSVIISQLIAYPDITNATLWQFLYVNLIISLGVKQYELLH